MTRITMSIVQVYTRQTLSGFQAIVHCYAGPRAGLREDPYTASAKMFPSTCAGTKDAYNYLQAELNRVLRCGFCPDCLARVVPFKRIRIPEAGVCAACVFSRGLLP
jgi:hypothetical protein